MLTLYAEKRYSVEGDRYNVKIYRDKERQNPIVEFSSFHSNKPTFRNKYIMLNCYRWKLEWLPSI